MLNSEIRAGKSRIEAFKSFAQRTKVDDVRALVAMLVQTDRFGTSIGQALRAHADTSRTKRRQRAEEAAQKIGVKLVFPLVLFFFPAFYVVGSVRLSSSSCTRSNSSALIAGESGRHECKHHHGRSADCGWSSVLASPPCAAEQGRLGHE